jgi:hypothetical protein
MSVGKISLLWKKLENALSLLAKSSQIWLLEKFLEEANKSGLGIGYTIITNKIDALFFSGKQKPIKEETTILNLKTEFTIKEPKRKQRKKPTKKKVEVEKNEIISKNDIKAGTYSSFCK